MMNLVTPMSCLISRLVESYLASIVRSLKLRRPREELEEGGSKCKSLRMLQMESLETSRPNHPLKLPQGKRMLASLADNMKGAHIRHHLQGNQMPKLPKQLQMRRTLIICNSRRRSTVMI